MGEKEKAPLPTRTYSLDSLGRRTRGPVLKMHSLLDSKHLATA